MILKNAQQGDSITIGVNLIDYETYRLESFKIYLGGVEYPCTISSNIVKCEISSNITSTFFGKKTLVFWIDDSLFGVKNFIIGDIIFGTLATLTNESINEGFDLLVPITFNDTAIVIGDVLYNYFRGLDAYEVWVQNGNEGKTYEEYIAFLQKPATDAAELVNITIENANEAATEANEKALLAQNAASNADAKATLANDAAILANEKATLANDKAAIAQTSATNANTAASNVNSVILSAGQLGSIKPTDAAPTPERNGHYVFSIGGTKPSWLSAEPLITEVKAGDGVSVVYTAPNTYSYTHIDAYNEIEQVRSQSKFKAPSSKVLDDSVASMSSKYSYIPAGLQKTINGDSFYPHIISNPSRVYVYKNGIPVDGIEYLFVKNGEYWDVNITSTFEIYDAEIVVYATNVDIYPKSIKDGNSILYDFKRLETITKNSVDVVTRVNDVFGSGNDLTQGHAQWTPDGFVFDNSAGVLDYLKSSGFTLNQPFSLYISFKQNNWAAGRYLFDGNTAGSVYALQSGTSPNIRVSAGSSSPIGVITSLTLGQFNVMRVSFNGAGGEIQINNSTPIAANLSTNNMGGLTIAAKGDVSASTFSGMTVKSILVRKVVDTAYTKDEITSWMIDRANEVPSFNPFSDECDGDVVDYNKWDVYIENPAKTKVTQNNALEFYSLTNDVNVAIVKSKISSTTGVFTFSAFSLCSEKTYSPSDVRHGLWINSRNRIEFYHKPTGDFNLAYRIVKDGVTVYEVVDVAKEFIQAKIIITETQISAFKWVNDAWVAIGTAQNYVFGAKRFFIYNGGISRNAKVSFRDVHIVESDFSTVTPYPQKTITAINARVFGAVPDNITDSAPFINKALQAGDVLIDNGFYAIGSPLLIPDNRTLYIRNARLYLKSGTHDNMIRNSDPENGNTNIKVIGMGNAILHGNGIGNRQPIEWWLPNNRYKKNIISLVRATDFEIANINAVERFSYFMTMQDSSFGKIHDVHLNHYDLDETYSHHDGIATGFGSHDIEIYRIKGVTGDDFTSIYCGGNAFLNYPGASLSGEVYNINYYDFEVAYGAGNVVDFIVGAGNKVHDISIENMHIGNCNNFVQLGYVEIGFSRPTKEDFKNIKILNNTVNKSAATLIEFLDNIKNVHVQNLVNNTTNASYEVSAGKSLENVVFEHQLLDQN